MCTMNFHILLLLLPQMLLLRHHVLPPYPRLSSPDKVLHRHLKLLQLKHVKKVTRARHTGLNESITSKLCIEIPITPALEKVKLQDLKFKTSCLSYTEFLFVPHHHQQKKKENGEIKTPQTPEPRTSLWKMRINSTSCPLP